MKYQSNLSSNFDGFDGGWNLVLPVRIRNKKFYDLMEIKKVHQDQKHSTDTTNEIS